MRHLLIISLIAVTCLSCKKEPKDPYVKDCGNPDGKIKQCLFNFFFDVGSYWVYQDIINAQYDSTYVYSWNNDLDIYIAAPGCGYYVQHIYINYISSYSGSYSDRMVDERFYSDDNYGYGCGDPTMDSLVVAGTTYYNVVETFLPDNDGVLYYKEGVGVIRKVYFNAPIDTITLDLINHQVTFFPNPF